MAMDFPSSPSVGQIVSLGGNQYIWDGVGWNIVPQQAPAALSDLPPANPAVGQFWWRSTNGQLYVYVNDGNSSQWVQAAGQGITPGAWEKIELRTISGLNSFVPFTDLGAFWAVRLTGFLTFSTATAWGWRTSINNGSSFDNGASDYNNQQVGGNGAVASAVQSTSTLTSASAFTSVVCSFETLVTNFNKATACLFNNDLQNVASGGSIPTKENSGGFRNSASPRNALQIVTTVVTTINGTVLVEGVRG